MATPRQQLIALITEREFTVPELASALGMKEKDVCEHLAHIRRTVRGRKQKLKVRPYACRQCGYEFEDRRRLGRPGRCPKCKHQRMEEAGFKIV